MPRALTPEELRDQLLANIRQIGRYWSRHKDPTMTIEDRVNGALFSMLSTLDGCSTDLPSFDLVAQPHPDDKAYHKKNGEDWIEPGTTISNCLHEHFYARPNES